VAEDDLLCIVVQLAERDKAATLLDYVGAGHSEALRVGQNAGIFLLD